MRNGKEKYPTYDALWHLVTMGILTPDHAPNGWAPDPKLPRKTRVAIIDTSVAEDHPNLRDVIDRKRAFDLFSTRLGAFAHRDPSETVGALDLNAATKVTTDLPRASELLAELIDRLSHDSPVRLGGVHPMSSPDFSNHGTAVAGLIGARPTVATVAEGHPSPVPELDDVPLPYCGADPNCEIVPISTNLDADPEALILAFLYAELIDADVIHVPRIIPDPTRTVPELHQVIDGVPLRDLVAHTDVSEEEMEAWEELATLIVNISLERPIVCAAGNANEEYGIYPANLASEHNGIISVGAVNAKGFGSGYSAVSNLTVCGPGDDSEVYDRTEIRLDPHRPDKDLHDVPSMVSNNKFSSYDIITTDVPGPYGYEGSPFSSDIPDEGVREFGSYFCRFGGTSASSALIAGFLSLARSTGEIGADMDGLAAKTWLMSHSVVLPDEPSDFRFAIWSGNPDFPDPRGE